MSKKHKAMRQGTPIRWDALDRIQKQHEETAAEKARKKMLEQYADNEEGNPFEEVKEPVTPEMAYKYMTREKDKPKAARSRMLERRLRKSSDDYTPGGVKQSGTASEARQQMIDRHAQPENGETADNANRSDAADARQRKKKYAAARNSVYKPKYRYIKKK